MTFGRLGELRTVEEARRKAAEIKLTVRAGRDPLEEVRAKRKVAERGRPSRSNRGRPLGP
jgi:hypothetical protein